MARGTTLSTLLTMLKAELGYSLTVGTADDARLKQLLAHTQTWLAGEYDWPYLKRTGDVALAVADRTGTIPTTLDTNRPMQVSSLDSDTWVPLKYGITAQDMTIWNSDDDQVADPILKYQYATDTTFEVWPRPATATTVRFAGMKKLATLTGDSDTADLDDLLIVLFCAADVAAGQKKADAGAKLARAQRRLQTLQAALPKPYQTFKLGGGAAKDDRDFMGGTIVGGSMANTLGGTSNIANGASSGSVTYNTGGVTPLSVILTVQAPAGGLVLVASLDGGATSTGFDYNLTGATDSGNYRLNWELTIA
jgi:hypothetical protein